MELKYSLGTVADCLSGETAADINTDQKGVYISIVHPDYQEAVKLRAFVYWKLTGLHTDDRQDTPAEPAGQWDLHGYHEPCTAIDSANLCVDDSEGGHHD
jgi:hypothetical protein